MIAVQHILLLWVETSMVGLFSMEPTLIPTYAEPLWSPGPKSWASSGPALNHSTEGIHAGYYWSPENSEENVKINKEEK